MSNAVLPELSKNTCISFVEKVRLFFSSTTLHGVRYIAGRDIHPIRRFIWTLTFVSCCILFVLTMSTQYHHYQSNPTLTVYDVMEDNPLRFPGFTVCNHNPFKRSYIESIPHMAEALEMIYPPFDDRRDFNVSNSTYYTSTEHLNFTALLDEGSFTVDEMMKECKFNNVIQKCSEIFSVVDTDIGRCFTFNSYSTIQKRRDMFANDPEATDLEKRGRFFSVQPGAKYNLVLRLHAHQEEYYYGPYASPGYKVIAHCPYQYPPVSDIGISISPGMESYLAVALSWVYNLPAPFDAGCETIDDIYDSLDFHTFYSEGTCYMETLTKLTIEKCGCKYFLHKGIGRDCGLEEMGRCFFPLERDFKSGLYPINCPILCEYDHYDNAVSSAQFPSQYVAQKLSENFNRSTEEYSDNIMTLSVYFEELKYTVIKKIEAYPLTQLGADLGGMFGLCVGASVLTILEFGELFGNAVYGGCKKLVQKRMAVMSVSK